MAHIPIPQLVRGFPVPEEAAILPSMPRPVASYLLLLSVDRRDETRRGEAPSAEVASCLPVASQRHSGLILIFCLSTTRWSHADEFCGWERVPLEDGLADTHTITHTQWDVRMHVCTNEPIHWHTLAHWNMQALWHTDTHSHRHLHNTHTVEAVQNERERYRAYIWELPKLNSAAYHMCSVCVTDR